MQEGWLCSCGYYNKGNICTKCGKLIAQPGEDTEKARPNLSPEEKDRTCRDLCPGLYEDPTFSSAMDFIRKKCNIEE